MRFAFAVGVGLVLPMLVSFAVMEAAADRISDRYLHAERVDDRPPGVYVADAADIALLPRPFQAALFAAATHGAADVALEGPVRSAWEQLRALTGGAARIAFEVDGVFVLIETRAAEAFAPEWIGPAAELAKQAERALWEKVGALLQRIAGG